MTGVAIFATHHYGGNNIEPHTSAPATMLHELRECVVDGMSFCKDSTQLEWLGFSWLTGGRGTNHLDTEGNPHVFLSRVVREVDGDEDGEGETEDEDEEVKEAKGEDGENGRREVGKGKSKDEGKQQNITFWAENDLDISEVQGVKMWDKAIWAGRL